jgi:DNA-binding response OmpR family regulator
MHPTTHSSTPSVDDHHLQHLRALLQTLTADLLELAHKAEVGIARPETGPLEHCPPRSETPSGVIDAGTFSVHWKGKTSYLGYTVLFRLMDHLVRHVNRFVSHQQLLDEVWGGERRHDY